MYIARCCRSVCAKRQSHTSIIWDVLSPNVKPCDVAPDGRSATTLVAAGHILKSAGWNLAMLIQTKFEKAGVAVGHCKTKSMNT